MLRSIHSGGRGDERYILLIWQNNKENLGAKISLHGVLYFQVAIVNYQKPVFLPGGIICHSLLQYDPLPIKCWPMSRTKGGGGGGGGGPSNPPEASVTPPIRELHSKQWVMLLCMSIVDFLFVMALLRKDGEVE